MSEESKRIVRRCPIHNIEMKRARVSWWEDALQGVHGKGMMVDGNLITHTYICRECINKQSVEKDGKRVRPAEKDFTPQSHRHSLEGMEKFLDGAIDFIYKVHGNKEPSAEELTLGMPNWFLRLKGYELASQKEIMSLRLKNAKLKKEGDDKIAQLESDLNEIEKELKDFLDKANWVS